MSDKKKIYFLNKVINFNMIVLIVWVLLTPSFGEASSSGCGSLLSSFGINSLAPQTEQRDPLDQGLDYDQEITRATGNSKMASIFIDGESHQIEIFYQIERERRISFPGALNMNSKTRLTEVLEFYFSTRYKEMQLKSNGGAMIPEFWNGGIMIRPLFSHYDHFHESSNTAITHKEGRRRVKVWENGKKPTGKMIESLYGKRIYFRPLLGVRREARNDVFTEYFETQFLVGSQNEFGVYFDTHDESLRQKGIAVRVKLWSSARDQLHLLPGEKWPSDLESSKVVHRMITIKMNSREENGFTLRDEIQVTVPKYIQNKDLEKWVNAVALLVLGNEEIENKILSPTKWIQNKRLGANLTELVIDPIEGFKEQKIGFITMDEFTHLDPMTGRSYQPQPQSQMEIEILPQLSQYVWSNPARAQQLNSLVESIQTRFNGIHVVRPKYLHDSL